ncbi:MAG: 8-amino-7-oxononanoate synthase [Thermoplasmatota archaeon]
MSHAFMAEELARIAAAGRTRSLRTIQSAPAPRIRMEGRDVLLLCSNNYLGLADDARLIAAGQAALERYGTSAGGSRLISGNTDLHRGLETDLAQLKGTDDAVLFPSGYQANLAAVAALVGPGDLVLGDRLNHASLIDACRLSRADIQVYDHADAEHAGRLLREHRRQHRRALVVTDGVFSMDGDLAPLRQLGEATAANDALLMVDDAHGTGVLGDGAGTARHLGATGVDIHMGTLSKALASQGGFIAASGQACEYLRNVARPFIFSTALAPASVAVARRAVAIVRDEPERRTRLHANAARLRNGLREAGLPVPAGETPIIPVVIGAEDAAMAFMQRLEAGGVYAAAVRPPTVAAGSCRIRATVMATHTAAQIDHAVAAFKSARRP